MKILLVNDEQAIRELIKAMLRENEIVEVENGDEALDIFTKHGPFDLVMTDMLHYGLDGETLVKRIKQTASNQAVLMMTADSNVGNELWKTLRVPILHVPFWQWELEQAVCLARCLNVTGV